jgi:predicted DNA-binding transcriptional regulator AlpA
MQKLNMVQEQLFDKLLPEYGLLLSHDTVCKLLGVSSSTLYRMREKKDGPLFRKDFSKSRNGTVRYQLIDVIHYITEDLK